MDKTATVSVMATFSGAEEEADVARATPRRITSITSTPASAATATATSTPTARASVPIRLRAHDMHARRRMAISIITTGGTLPGATGAPSCGARSGRRLMPPTLSVHGAGPLDVAELRSDNCCVEHCASEVDFCGGVRLHPLRDRLTARVHVDRRPVRRVDVLGVPVVAEEMTIRVELIGDSVLEELTTYDLTTIVCQP